MLDNDKIGDNVLLEVKNLKAEIGGKGILNGVNLKINSGEFHVLMGPNGSGKTTLAKAIMGHPAIKITGGDIAIDGSSILGLSPDKRAKAGLFMLFQNPAEIDGVGFVNFIRSAVESLNDSTINTKYFMDEIKAYAESLNFDKNIVGRSLNKGFSGGEKKKAEVLQMALLKPKMAILDEPDSGLDVDAIKVVAKNINSIAQKTHPGMLVITHYSRILQYMEPEFVHIMNAGRIITSGGHEIIERIEKNGYDSME
ncbi:Fe-S cluster assembly ATPase SufC [Candidatus Marsarchaeota archaeon]|nr:Fe-S cluster assembly ATPase SufC [Candidatus Marsarchaeota archaeon]MCL5404916.1 Fe-S cluster assembly ATPase SufC [Candidatus Marsarchaeota archaeon]